ncbi:MAG: Gfo/Idh/MocA family oxidoreductase [Candidatus Latescibacteria bacterium]|nr:Gfo/Idh/MocA family oxidoreductase [Candidatus Latescibacterota bacterium]
MQRLRIALLGIGNHSLKNHVPSLVRYVEEHPDEIELAALCDVRGEEAQSVAEQHGFGRVYADLDEMLRQEALDGCVAVTPVRATLAVASRLIRAGIPLLMEKPPGANLAETRRIVDLVEESAARVMVSVNRRFDLALQSALSWQGDRSLQYLRATMVRHQRVEEAFVQATAIHAVDAMRSVAGDVKDFRAEARQVAGAQWLIVHLEFIGGQCGTLEVLPSAGCRSEEYAFFGADYSISARVAEFDVGKVKAWEDGELVLEEESGKGLPEYVRNGAYGETAEFIAALKEDRVPVPTPAAILQSVEICDALGRGFERPRVASRT